MSKVTVQPGGPDRRVPVEPLRNPPTYFEQGVSVTVERTRYIEQRLADGDLVEVEAKPAASPNPAPAPEPPAPPAATKAGA